MKYGIDCGHGCPPDTGAVGCGYHEDTLTLAVGQRVMSQLRVLGHEVVDCRPLSANSVKNSLEQRCQIANSAGVDIFVSIHLNAFNGKAYGTEVFAMSESGRNIATSVLNHITQLGFFNRGVKDGSRLYVLRHTIMPAILVECCFLDNQNDMNRFDVEKMANAITLGLTRQYSTQSQQYGLYTTNLEVGDKWLEFIRLLKTASIEYPLLKPAQLAQAILESGRGKSQLFLQHNNPYGMKWRREMQSVAIPTQYIAHDGQEEYCKFTTLENAVHGYWNFINRTPYKGWKLYTHNPDTYLKFIVEAGYSQDKEYLNKLLRLLPEATDLLT
jgi:hypothetical protein